MQEPKENFKSGFVNILGRPNVGKSTLLNRLVGEQLAIATPKAQTTRNRILGIYHDTEHQIIFSDTPGVIDPKYQLQEWMMKEAHSALQDADVLLFLTEFPEPNDSLGLEFRKKTNCPSFLILNKSDLKKGDQEPNIHRDKWDRVFEISALKGKGVKKLFEAIKKELPIHPPYYDEEQLTDKNERFIASEIVRKQVFELFQKEIPYSTQVDVESFIDEPDLLSISAVIIVERDTQKGIIIGNKGSMIKKIGIRAREEMEEFFGKKIFLETFVKVEKDWRKKEEKLKKLGFK